MESAWFCKKRVPSEEDEHHQQTINKTQKKEVKKKIQKQTKTRKNLKIFYTNADQLTNSKKRELNEVVIKEQPDIIAICEVKPKNGKKERLIQDYSIEGYSEPYETNATNNVGRGIVVLVHESLKNLVLEIKLNSKFQEVCLIEVKLEGTDSLLFGCIYRSPTSTPTSPINNANLNLLLKEIATTKQYSHKCIVGDFNYRDINWDNWSTPHDDTKEDEMFLNALRDTFFYQHVNEPTRARGTDTPSLIDLILSNEESQVNNLAYLAPLGKSDHSVLSFTFECYIEQESTSKNYNYNRANFKAMKGHLETSNWITDFLESSFKKRRTRMTAGKCCKINCLSLEIDTFHMRRRDISTVKKESLLSIKIYSKT